MSTTGAFVAIVTGVMTVWLYGLGAPLLAHILGNVAVGIMAAAG